MAATIPTSQTSFIMYFCMMFFFGSFMNAQNTTAIIDSNFEHALINLGIDTNGFNGNILNTDAESVISLHVFEKNISNLQGIEAFLNLLYLSAYSNNLSNLDLSENSKLEIIDIENNGLETLNISQNTNLKEIYVANNLLQSINTSHITDLELLSCSLNFLTELDVSNNFDLEVLWCYSNYLTNLDVSNNTELETLSCGDNNLSSLNISNNFDLHSLMTSGNNLNAISFSACSNISYIDISNNLFTELDLSLNTQVVRLLCENNNITELDLFNAPNLMLLFAGGNQLEDLDISMNSRLRFVRLADNNLQTLDIRNNSNQTISSFTTAGNGNLSCIMVDDEDATYLSNWTIDNGSNFVADYAACNSLSVSAINENFTFQMYPNPASDVLNIKNMQPNSKVTIYNTSGQLVKQQAAIMDVLSLDVSSLSSGMYLLEVSSLNQSRIQKIIIN